MMTTSGYLTSLGVGAGLMYLLDPQQGARRRALLRDQLVHAARKTRDAVDTTSRDAANRLHGAAAEARSATQPAVVRDDVLVERVRSRLGRVAGHPRAIEVAATDGRVTLRGPILAADVERVIHGVAGVRGVREIDNQFEVHEEAGDIPALQGGRRFPPLGIQRHWSPTARLFTGTVGGALLWYGGRRQGLTGALLDLFGAGLAIRAVADRPFGELFACEESGDADASATFPPTAPAPGTPTTPTTSGSP
jgi:hypothetical protein